ncbi:unnamed protein product [Tilletia controversa]|nr:hypothetical protein CF335_g3434 [Tilletia laevis]CAD6931112.1 unnamed protein product [Tilletia controversa]CAD6970592.1 unnamed protein product [Tilletia controversa]CAD6972596.1 unnamed protein product [Tilletia controversa]
MSNTLRDFSAGEGLRRTVLVRNAMLANLRRVELIELKQAQQQQQHQQQQQQLALQAANQSISHHTAPADDDDEDEDDAFVPVSYPWQQRAAEASTPDAQQPTHSQGLAYEGDLSPGSSSTSSSSSASPSSSTSSLPASIIDEQEQAWFDEVLFELENGLDDDDDDAADDDDDEADDEALLDSVSSIQPADGLVRSKDFATTSSLELSSSLEDVPDLITDDEEDPGSSDDDDADDDDDEEAQHLPPSSRKLPPSPARVVVHSSNSIPASIDSDIPSRSHNRFLTLSGSADKTKQQKQQQQKQLPGAEPGTQDAVLHLLPPTLALPRHLPRPVSPDAH